jgi:hypothetical protein
VEAQRQLERLQSIDCAEIQSYLFCRARPASEIGAFECTFRGQGQAVRTARSRCSFALHPLSITVTGETSITATPSNTHHGLAAFVIEANFRN